ncbi:MAG: nickel transport protein [Desulfonauticus sp.]|nr:nickel transport protein [Desulfonauticus sp.]
MLKKAIFTIILILGFTALASAHRVNIFCFVEGKKISCEANYPSGDKVKHGTINLKEAETQKTLASKKTDLEGKASFEITQDILARKKDLEAEVLAGMGHRNTWTIPYSDLNAESSEISSKENTGSNTSLPWESNTSTPASATSVDKQELEMLISKIMDKKLHPVLEKLTLLQERKISLPDILAGLGYILGLMGISFYFLAKKNEK